MLFSGMLLPSMTRVPAAVAATAVCAKLKNRKADNVMIIFFILMLRRLINFMANVEHISLMLHQKATNEKAISFPLSIW
jgi:hypothetical protein